MHQIQHPSGAFLLNISPFLRGSNKVIKSSLYILKSQPRQKQARNTQQEMNWAHESLSYKQNTGSLKEQFKQMHTFLLRPAVLLIHRISSVSLELQRCVLWYKLNGTRLVDPVGLHILQPQPLFSSFGLQIIFGWEVIGQHQQACWATGSLEYGCRLLIIAKYQTDFSVKFSDQRSPAQTSWTLCSTAGSPKAPRAQTRADGRVQRLQPAEVTRICYSFLRLL